MNARFPCIAAIAASLLAGASVRAEDSENIAGEWPQWRGADRSNASRETGLLQQWPVEGPPRLWTAAGIGLGIHSVSVARGRVFTTGNLDGNEIAFALDAGTGEKVWDHRLDATIKENPLMRWMTQRSPTVDEERVYVLTMSGKLVCMRNGTGQRIWEVDYVKQFGATGSPWGYRDTPLVDGDRLICTPYGANGYAVALDKRTGETIWVAPWAKPPSAGYASLVVSEAGGIRQYVVFHARGLAGFAASDGKRLWNYTRPITRTASTYTPLVRDDLICSPNGYGGGLVLLKLANANGVWTTTELYQTGANFNPFQDNTAYVGEYIYTALQNKKPACIEFRSGKVLWEAAGPPDVQRTALTYADGHLYFRYANGVMSLVEAHPNEYRENGSFKIPEHEASSGVTSPIIAGRRLYLRDNDRLHCFDVSRNALASKRGEPRRIAIKIAENVPGAGEVERRLRTGRDRAPDAVFVPTPNDVVAKMLEVGEVKSGSVLIDLGSGDGRILIAAAKKFGCKAIGYEIDKWLVESSREAVVSEKLEHLVNVEHEDIFTQDFSKADVVTVFLYPPLMERLIPQFNKLKPGSRIVSHQFEIPGIKPDRIYTVDSAETGDKHRVLVWTVPLDMPRKNSNN